MGDQRRLLDVLPAGTPAVRTVVFDADLDLSGGPLLSAEETAMLQRLEHAGILLVCVTAAPAVAATAALAAAKVHPVILSDVDGEIEPLDATPLELGMARADALLQKFDLLKTNYQAACVSQAACVVATQPADFELLAHAALGFAVEGAGYRACAAADKVFPPRADGGLALALAAALEAAAFGPSATGL